MAGKQKGNGTAPKQKRKDVPPTAPGFDKKLDGPNIPST